MVVLAHFPSILHFSSGNGPLHWRQRCCLRHVFEKHLRLFQLLHISDDTVGALLAAGCGAGAGNGHSFMLVWSYDLHRGHLGAVDFTAVASNVDVTISASTAENSTDLPEREARCFISRVATDDQWYLLL